VTLKPANRGEGPARDCFAAVADTPLGLDPAVDADKDVERFSPVPPAKPRAGDDPGVLVEPVALVGRGWAAVASQPGLEVPRAGRQRYLVERLFRRPWHVEGGRPRPAESLRSDGAPWSGAAYASSA
jgi:hypothetical protein